MFAQIASVTWLNLANLRSRLGASTIIVVGVAGVVAVLLGLLAMSAGFRSALVDTAKQDRALIVRNGSNNEMGGWVSADELALIETYEAIDVASGVESEPGKKDPEKLEAFFRAVHKGKPEDAPKRSFHP